LVSEDVPLLKNLVTGVFPGYEITRPEDKVLREAVAIECKKRHL